jgi:type IV fimbrial biogenesis protein FimT
MRQRGFTLIELMVTVSVLVLILFMALPSIGTWLDNTRIRNTADSLQSGLQQARSEAVRQNRNVSFWLVSIANAAVLSNDCTLSGGSSSWIVSVNSPIGHCGDSPSTTSSPMIVVGRAAGDSGGRVVASAVQSDLATAGTTVTFNGFGRIANSDAISQINVTGNGSSTQYRQLRLELSPAGEVRMCDPRVTSSADSRKCVFATPP